MFFICSGYQFFIRYVICLVPHPKGKYLIGTIKDDVKGGSFVAVAQEINKVPFQSWFAEFFSRAV